MDLTLTEAMEFATKDQLTIYRKPTIGIYYGDVVELDVVIGDSCERLPFNAVVTWINNAGDKATYTLSAIPTEKP